MFEPYTLLGGFVFGTIGMGSFAYGRSLDRWKPKVLGILLMIYPYFITNRWAMWAVGVILCGTLWFHHDE